MEELLEPMLKAKINKDIEHQGIGGKIIILERKLNFFDAPINIALNNYIKRRNYPTYDHVIYYGHVGGLGYFVGEDELSEIKEATKKDIKNNW